MADRYSAVNRHVNPLLVDLPEWVRTIRPHQIEAVNEVLASFQSARLVFLDAPTGTGKTLIAEIVRRMLHGPMIYTCTTKSLQQQFVEDFPYARQIKGRANYPTELFEEDFPDITCEDCTIASGACMFCAEEMTCPYQLAKGSAAQADVAVLNGAYLLAETKSKRSPFKHWPLMVMDEADTLEQELMRYVTLEISERRMRQWHWEPPEKITVAESWKTWLMDHARALTQIRETTRLNEEHGTVRYEREMRFMARMRAEMLNVAQGLDSGVWVYNPTERGIEFKPSRVDQMGGMLWGISEMKWLLMSATPISVPTLLDSIGWDEGFKVVRVPSQFPVENRRVRYVPVGAMNRKEKDVTLPKVALGLAKILERDDGHRVLVHTVSYANSRDISLKLRKMTDRKVMTYGSARERQHILKEFAGSPGAVLLAPSMDRGIDLPDDACRVQVILKVPYPNLGDRQVKARTYSHGGRTWYLCETVRTLVQMCGRAVRSPTDWAETWVLDADFESLWSRARGLFPKWFADAIIWRPEAL